MHEDAAHVTELCKELEISCAALYNHVTPEGKFTARGEALLNR